MAAAAKDVLQQFYVELIQVLPLESDQFFAIIKNAGLLPLDTGDNIRAERTRSAKVSYLLSHVIEPGAKEYLPLLLKAMEESKASNVVNLAQEIRAALGGTCFNSIAICTYIKYTYVCMHTATYLHTNV